MIHGVSAGATVPFSPLALVPPPSSRPDVGGTYAIIRVCYRPLLADRCETPPRAPTSTWVGSSGPTVPFSPLALVPPTSSRPDVGGTYAIIRVCYRPLLADRFETPPRAPTSTWVGSSGPKAGYSYRVSKNGTVRPLRYVPIVK